jgi:hypothetical protein
MVGAEARKGRAQEEAMFRRVIVALCGAALMAACTSSSPTAGSTTPPAVPPSTPPSTQAPSPTASESSGAIDPANFVSVIDNPYYPLTPGTTLVYEGTRDGKSQRDVVQVTHDTTVVMGVTCVVVLDTATHNGSLIEKTEDWFAQDKDGNVWYFGEDTAEYENGKVVSREGSWTGGVDGAVPGIIMMAHPEVPVAYRQEYLKGHAEDMAWVVSLGETVKVPAGSYHDVMLTIEWTPLEPKVLDKKLYAPGIGIVQELSQSGPLETAALVSVTTGP